MAKKKKSKKVTQVVSKTKKESSTTCTLSSKKPSTDGKFKPGNTASKGATGPEIKHRLELANAFKSAISVSDIKTVAEALLVKAKTGDVKAAKEVLDRCLGKAKETVEIDFGDKTLDTILRLIDGRTKGQLPDAAEGEDARQ